MKQCLSRPGARRLKTQSENVIRGRPEGSGSLRALSRAHEPQRWPKVPQVDPNRVRQ
jgi:hypothetical protein